MTEKLLCKNRKSVVLTGSAQPVNIKLGACGQLDGSVIILEYFQIQFLIIFFLS